MCKFCSSSQTAIDLTLMTNCCLIVTMAEPGPRIRKLDANVVNKIAAGEIIIQPVNALKELLENSIDARATVVDILVKDGGVKLLQITDNGSGIQKQDLPLLCERFATSKLNKFDDLMNIGTYGFRGEALASISHVSRLSVITKTRDSPLAYKAYYVNGELTTPNFKLGDAKAVEPKPIAGKDGTQIIVEDLFYNIPTRLKSLRSKSEELAKIIDVIGRYAVHCQTVGFSCKKVEKSELVLSTRPQMTIKDRIRSVFGSPIANEIIEFEPFTNQNLGIIEVKGAFTSPSCDNKKKITPIFFINQRLVSCDPLKRAISSVFQVYLPKGSYPFLYLSLQIKPENVDVNIHPTKREVRFLHEEEIIEVITDKFHDCLSNINTSRKFKSQNLLADTKRSRPDFDNTGESVKKKYRQENKLVRVDTNQTKINKFLVPEVTSNATQKIDSSVDLIDDEQIETETSVRERVTVNLDSINELRKEVSDSIHRELTNVFNNAVYVGVVDSLRRLCCFQYDVKLFICDYSSILYEFYYQVALSEFCNYGEFILSEPIRLVDLLNNLYNASECTTSRLTTPKQEVIDKIVSMQDMLKEYFQLTIIYDDNNEPMLHTLPMIMKEVTPVIGKIPYFIYRLGNNINYEDEKQCLQGILRQISLLYIPEPIPDDNESENTKRDSIDYDLDNLIFPQLKLRFLATKDLVPDIVQIADLPGLYKVFERC